MYQMLHASESLHLPRLARSPTVTPSAHGTQSANPHSLQSGHFLDGKNSSQFHYGAAKSLPGGIGWNPMPLADFLERKSAAAPRNQLPVVLRERGQCRLDAGGFFAVGNDGLGWVGLGFGINRFSLSVVERLLAPDVSLLLEIPPNMIERRSINDLSKPNPQFCIRRAAIVNPASKDLDHRVLDQVRVRGIPHSRLSQPSFDLVANHMIECNKQLLKRASVPVAGLLHQLH